MDSCTVSNVKGTRNWLDANALIWHLTTDHIVKDLFEVFNKSQKSEKRNVLRNYSLHGANISPGCNKKI